MTSESWRGSTMPFGQYKGWEIEKRPNSYLRWLLRTVLLSRWLHDAVSEEYRRRADQYDSRDHHQDRTPPPAAGPGIRLRPDEVPLAQRVFDAGYRSVARRIHPDVGGDVNEMARLNALADSVRNQIDALEAAK
jgi:hypothetical protein